VEAASAGPKKKKRGGGRSSNERCLRIILLMTSPSAGNVGSPKGVEKEKKRKGKRERKGATPARRRVITLYRIRLKFFFWGGGGGGGVGGGRKRKSGRQSLPALILAAFPSHIRRHREPDNWGLARTLVSSFPADQGGGKKEEKGREQPSVMTSGKACTSPVRPPAF